MTLGIVCGLRIEAACFSSLPRDHIITICGGSVDRVESCVHDLIDQGATSLCSMGIAGGLDATLHTGDVVLATCVLASDGETSIMADIPWRMRLEEQLHKQGISPIVGGVVMSNHVVASRVEKAELYARTRGLCVDLESAATARIATQRGIPFAVLRVIADDACCSLPQAALVGIDRHGKMRFLPVLRTLLSRPYEFTSLLSIAVQTARALSVLRRVTKGLVL